MYLMSIHAFTYVLMKMKAFAVILRSLSVMSRRICLVSDRRRLH